MRSDKEVLVQLAQRHSRTFAAVLCNASICIRLPNQVGLFRIPAALGSLRERCIGESIMSFGTGCPHGPHRHGWLDLRSYTAAPEDLHPDFTFSKKLALGLFGETSRLPPGNLEEQLVLEVLRCSHSPSGRTLQGGPCRDGASALDDTCDALKAKQQEKI